MGRFVRKGEKGIAILAPIVGRRNTDAADDDSKTSERIQVLNGLSPAETFIVLAHEYAHCLMHRADDRPASRDTRELEREAVAVTSQVGMKPASTEFTASWPPCDRRGL
jgi:uncharacterized protein DUF955